MNTADQARKAEAFRALHQGPQALVMANAWDAMTARMFELEGFPAIATTSGGVAGALGFRDGEGAPWNEVVEQTMRVVRAVSVPVTADIEGGFGATADEVGRHVGEIIGVGAIGVNLEDSIPGQGGMRSLEDGVARVRAARAAAAAAGVPIFINARVDLFIRQVGEGEAQLDAAIERGLAYLAAGADGIYPIGLRDEPTIKRLCGALRCPININVRAGHPTVAALEALGVRRISTATSLAMLALSVVRDAVRGIRANGRFDLDNPSVTGADMAGFWRR